MGLYSKFEESLGQHPNLNYLLASESLKDAFRHLDRVSYDLQRLKGTRIEDGQQSAYEQWGSPISTLETQSQTEDCEGQWRFVFDTPVQNSVYIHPPVVQICSGKPHFYRFVMTFTPERVKITQDFDCVDASPNLSKILSQKRQAICDLRVTLAERERQDAEYAVQRIAVLGPARVFIHAKTQRASHVTLVANIENQMQKFLEIYKENTGRLDPQSPYRLINGGWAGTTEGSTGVPFISSLFGIPTHDPGTPQKQKEPVTVMPSFGAYDRVKGVDDDNYYEVPGTWGDDSRYLVGYSTSLVIFEPYGFWTDIELYYY